MRIILLLTALLLAWGPLLSTAAGAAVVGKLTQVEGRVDLLKGGKLPATPVKVGDAVGAGDVLRSKSRSKAQVTFIDDSVINISPESRLAIEDYRFDPGQGKRMAVLQVFRGLAHVVVNKIFKVDEPDFIVKTHTAITGVRGTDFGIRLLPNSSTILNFEGKTRVGNVFPEAHTWEQRMKKIAYQQAQGGGFFVPGSFVDLGGMQGTTVQAALPPTLPYAISPQDRQMFLNQLAGGLTGRQGAGGGDQGAGAGGGYEPLGAQGGGTGNLLVSNAAADSTNLGLTSGTGSTDMTVLNTVTVPPTVVPTSTGGGSTPTPTPSPTPSTFTFSQQYYGAFITLSDSPYSAAALAGYSWGYRSGVYDGYFYSLTDGSRTASEGTTFATMTTGTNTATATGTVTGILGGTLTGTMTWTSTVAGTTITRTGDVTILSTGETTYGWTDQLTNGGGEVVATGAGTTNQTPGTHFTSSVSGEETTTANLAGNQATTTNYGDLEGTRVIDGISSDIKAAFSVTNTATSAGTFTSSEPQGVSIESEGVLGAPDANGKRVGVMTSTATTDSGSSNTGGPVTYIPASGSSPQASFTQVIGDSSTGPQGTTLGISAQTSNLSATIGTQTYEGSGTMTSESPYTTGAFNSSGWGISSAPGPEGPENVPFTGDMTATVTQTGGGTFDPGTEVIRYNSAAVVALNGSGNYEGPAQGVGVVAPNKVISTTGTINANTETGVTTTTFSGLWGSPEGKGTISAGTQTMTPGTYFEQTTNASTGTVTLSTPSATPPYTQTATLAATMTRSEVAPGANQVLSPSSVITSTTNGALPPAATVPAAINIQGVVAPGGSVQSGNMTLTIHNPSLSPGMQPVSTYTGPVSIDTLNGALNASLTGKNPANPGVNRAPAEQTGVVQSAPSP